MRRSERWGKPHPARAAACLGEAVCHISSPSRGGRFGALARTLLKAPFLARAARVARISSVVIAEAFSATAAEMNWLIETPSRLAISLIWR